MSPDGRQRRSKSQPRRNVPEVKFRPSPDDEHEVVYFRRHRDDDAAESAPGRAFLNEICPKKVRTHMRVVLGQVAISPPKKFAGGGYWEKMRGEMAGWYEVRVDGPRRHHYRLFCLLDYDARDATKPLLVIVDGRDKPFRTELSASEYAAVRKLGAEYCSRNPRCVE